VMRAADSQPIDPSEFVGQVESGMVLEMSIVLRQRTAYQKKCPRCGYINMDVAVKNGWIEWPVYSNLSIYVHN